MTVPRALPRMSGMHRTAGFAPRLLLLLAALGTALPVLPQTPGYTVEIIVFRNTGDAGALDGNAPRPAPAADDITPAIVASRRLGGSVARLNRNGLRVLGQAAWRQDPVPRGSRRGVSAASLGLSGITGKVIFEREPYLYLGVDLMVEDGGKRYHINEVRRVKKDEIHYFDHPSVGVLAILTD